MQLGIAPYSLKPGSIATSALSIHHFLTNFLKFYECNYSLMQTFTKINFWNSLIYHLGSIKVRDLKDCRVMIVNIGNVVLKMNNHFSKFVKSLVSKFWKIFNITVSKSLRIQTMLSKLQFTMRKSTKKQLLNVSMNHWIASYRTSSSMERRIFGTILRKHWLSITLLNKTFPKFLRKHVIRFWKMHRVCVEPLWKVWWHNQQ
jgi:hypothetical protein